MVESCANKITSFLICSKTIEEKEYDLYLYGFKTLIAFIVNIVVILFIGYILNRFKETALFLLCYCPIRQFTGGYHADTHVGCNVCYCGTYMISLLMLRIQMYVRGTIITWLIALAGYLIIVLNAPLEHHNKKLTMEQKEKYMIVSAVLGIASMLISFILNIIGVVIRYGKYSFLCQISLYINTMLLIIGLLLLLGVRKEGRFHEEDS